VDNVSEMNNNNELQKDRIISIKSNQSFNESNLMTLPFISLKREKVYEIERKWDRNGKEVGLRVVGTKTHGCPTIYELDVLMALLKILSKNMDNKIVVSNTNNSHKVTNMPKVINFTYKKLAKEMGFKGWGKTTKQRLERSIKCLNECTLYSTLSIRDNQLGEYIVDFDGLESSRILKNYKSYSVNNFKLMNKTLLDPNKVEEYQSVEIDDFFFNNMCNNYFKLYDYDKYKKLTKSIAKKLLLILTQWSHGYEKYINYTTLYDYIGIEVIDKKSEYYYKREIKKALDELVDIKFINAYEIASEGINFVFNTTRKIKAKGLDKYTTEIEVITRLREINISYDDITKYCIPETMQYIAGLLRYVDDRNSLGYVDNLFKFTRSGLPLNSYDIRGYINEF